MLTFSITADDKFLRRFWSKVQKTPTCWLWTGSLDSHGYGQIGYKRTTKLAHRVMWYLEHGAFQKAIFILHSCDTPACVNPSHLFEGTQTINMRDMASKHRGVYPHLKGEASGRSRLTNSQVLRIRELYRTTSQKELAKLYGVCKGTIQHIVRFKTWTHI